MAAIRREDVEAVAALARLEVSADEARTIARDLEAILAHFEALQSLDTEGVEGTAHPLALDTPVRRDRAVPPMDPALAVRAAPDHEGTSFVVPAVLPEDEDG